MQVTHTNYLQSNLHLSRIQAAEKPQYFAAMLLG